MLQESARRLLGRIPELRDCRTFEDVIARVRDTIGDLRGIGPLTIYDTALRIAAKLNLEPKLVYLHAGTRGGAKALGLNIAREAVSPSELPPPFSRLLPREVEDVLCLYKGPLQSLRTERE